MLDLLTRPVSGVKPHECHPERSEGSAFSNLRSDQSAKPASNAGFFCEEIRPYERNQGFSEAQLW